MRLYRLALVTLAASLCAVLRAAPGDDSSSDSDSDQNKKPPTEIPDFSHLDEYIYVPRSTLNFGYRYSTGVKTSFKGTANVTDPDQVTDHTSSNILRVYHDGAVGPDTRAGAIDLGNGSTGSVPFNAADGKTNDFSFDNASQVTSEGFLQFHTYSDQTANAAPIDQTAKANTGMELFVAHDQARYSKHWELKLFGAMSINDIQSASYAVENSNVTTVTDTYDTYGATLPLAGTAAGTSSQLISAAPILSTTGTALDTQDLTEHFKLHGAYATFRAGPELLYDFTDHWKLSVSAGPTMLFAGSTFEVDAVFVPPTGFQIVDTLTNTTNKLLFGGYLDATLQYDLTDRTGFYLGAFDQISDGYKQSANSAGGYFTTDVDFGNQDGLRTGLSFKF